MAAYQEPGKAESILGLLGMVGPLLDKIPRKTSTYDPEMEGA
jgi:hypothetical protein